MCVCVGTKALCSHVSGTVGMPGDSSEDRKDTYPCQDLPLAYFLQRITEEGKKKKKKCLLCHHCNNVILIILKCRIQRSDSLITLKMCMCAKPRNWEKQIYIRKVERSLHQDRQTSSRCQAAQPMYFTITSSGSSQTKPSSAVCYHSNVSTKAVTMLQFLLTKTKNILQRKAKVCLIKQMDLRSSKNLSDFK